MVLTSCEIINEGFDLPVVTTAILLRKTSSLGLHLQQVGRVLRTHPDKTHSIVIDHVGNLFKHGVAEQDREWSLEGRPKQDRKENKGDGFSQCLECFAMYQGDECPECGWKKPAPVAEMEVIDVELEEFRVKPVSEAKTYSDLRKMAKAKGYKPGWAYHAAREAGIRTPFKIR
jgi:DNA repair protein RadD